VSPNMDIANAALPAYVTVLLFFVGLLLRPQDQPSYWHWFSYLDFLKYAWAAQMINQFEHSHAVALDFQTVRARAAGRGFPCRSMLDRAPPATRCQPLHCQMWTPTILLQGFTRDSNSHEGLRLTPPVTPSPQPRAGVRAALA